MELISIIAIIVIFSKIFSKAGNAASKVERYGSHENVWDQMASQAKSVQNQARQYASAQNSRASSQNDQWQKAARENIEKARRRATEKLREVESVLEIENNPVKQQENRSAMQQIHAGRMEARNTSILQRAKANADEDRVDVTLETMEREHNHSERVSPAEHHHPEDILSESMLGTVEDLMVKGYDGNLCFERDFVGEAMDMINRFTISTDIPDPSVDDVA